MSEQHVTASTVISFAEELENRSTAFYTQLGDRFAEHEDAFRRYAKDCTKNKTLVTRTYQETVSDALETGYSFEGLDLGAYAVDFGLAEGLSLSDALGKAMALEESAAAFYHDVAERSRSLLATIPRAFTRVAKKREGIRSELGTLQS